MENILKKFPREKGWAAISAFFLAIVPVLCCVLRCLLDGQSLLQIYLPASSWNDELFYYKMTENVVNYGYPQGYFGFNESHGMYLSFAAWSPVLLLFWVIWGLLLGWNLLSPILCNIVLLSLAMLLFGILAKPGRRQALEIALLYAAFMPVTRFALSCIPEAELFALFIVFLGLAINCGREYKGWKAGALFALVMLMTWMRPYLILLFMTPGIFLFREKGKKTLFLSGGLALITAAVYVAINHFFSAPYLEDLFYTEWISVYFQEGLFKGLYYTAWKLCSSFRTVVELMRANLTQGSGLVSAAGLYYFIFLLLVVVLVVRCLCRVRRKNQAETLCADADAGGLPQKQSSFRAEDAGGLPQKQRPFRADGAEKSSLPILEGQMLLCMAAFFVADLLMYRIQEGGRHTLVYIVGCLFLLPMADFHVFKRKWLFPAGAAAFFILLFTVRGNVPYEFSIPYGSEEYRTELQVLTEELSGNMELSEPVPSYDNTIVWVFRDTVNGETGLVDFGSYYAVPKGFGINLCLEGYVEQNLENLQSRYIGVTPGGEFEKRIRAAGGKLIGESSYLAVYEAASHTAAQGQTAD